MFNKKIIIALALLLAVAIIPSAYAWQYPEMAYRNSITIISSSNETNYQIPLNITYDSNMNASFKDLRFSDSTDSRNLSYWVESYTPSISALVWVKGNFTTLNGIQAYMYYGNSTAGNMSNLSSTFGASMNEGFTFSESSGTTTRDITDSGKNGTLTNMNLGLNNGSSGFNSSGYYNNSLSFDGSDDYVNISNSRGTSANFSATFWVKMNVLNNQLLHYPVGQSDGSTGWEAGIVGTYSICGGTTGKVYLYTGIEGNATCSKTAMSVGNWYFVAVTYNGTQAAVYVNGTFENATIQTVIPNNFYTLFGMQTGGSWKINGMLDNVMIYNRTLLASEISGMYANPKPTYSFGTKESSSNPPIITILSPSSSIYYTTNLTLNFTVKGINATYPCWLKNDSALISLGSIANNTVSTNYVTDLGGSHTLNVTCYGGAPSVNVSSIVTPYVWMGLNVSVWNNATGAAMTNWTINITNGTATYGAINQNNPALYEWNSTVNGTSNITISDGSTTLYFFNYTFLRFLNNSAFIQLNATLQPKPPNNISLTSSSGWTLTEGQSTTISCMASELTPQFIINNIIVGSPYTLSVQNGQYVAGCNALTETPKYAPYNASNTMFVNPLISCTSNSTFAYNAQVSTATNQTTLDFTTFVNQNIVRANLGDVYVSNVNQTWINTVGGYFIIVNNTGLTSLNVSFGNYWANKSYSTSATLGNTYNITTYSQINPYVQYNILHELTGAYFFPPNATLTSIIHCSEGETYIPIEVNTTKLLIASSDYIDKASLRVLYSADAYYSRQFYPSASNALVLKFYTADAFVNPLDRIDFIVQDIKYYGSKLQVYKTVGNETLVITEGYFDASHAFSAYLLEDIDYYLQTINLDGTTTSFDRISIVAPSVKYIGNVQMQLNPNAILIADKLLMNAWTNTPRTTLYVVYNDGLNQTNNFTVTILFQNGTVFQNNTYVGVNSLSTSYDITPWTNESFSVYFSVNHQILGNSPVNYMIPLNPTIIWDLGISTIWYRLISLIGTIMVGGIASKKSIVFGGIMTMMAVILFQGIGWLNISTVSVFFIGVLLVLAIATYHRQGGE